MKVDQEFIDDLYNRIFNTKVLGSYSLQQKISLNLNDENSPIVNSGRLNVGVLVMSADTYMEIVRFDYSGSITSRFVLPKNTPYTVFGVRVAFDDSLPQGRVLIGGQLLG